MNTNKNSKINQNKDKKTKVGPIFDKWYMQVLQEYTEEFDCAQERTRNFTERKQVVDFFQKAFVFWYSRKPQLGKKDDIDVLDVMKTMKCLKQISVLEAKISKIDGIDFQDLDFDLNPEIEAKK